MEEQTVKSQVFKSRRSEKELKQQKNLCQKPRQRPLQKLQESLMRSLDQAVMSDDEIVPKVKHTYIQDNSSQGKKNVEQLNRTLRMQESLEGKRFLKETISSSHIKQKTLESKRNFKLDSSSRVSLNGMSDFVSNYRSASKRQESAKSLSRMTGEKKSLYQFNNCRKQKLQAVSIRSRLGEERVSGKKLRSIERSFVGPGSYKLPSLFEGKTYSSRNLSTVGGVIDRAGYDQQRGVKALNLSPKGKDSPGVGKYSTERRNMSRIQKGANFGTQKKYQEHLNSKILTEHLPFTYLGTEGSRGKKGNSGVRMGSANRFNYLTEKLRQKEQSPGPGTAGWEQTTSFKPKEVASVTYARLGRREEKEQRDRFAERLKLVVDRGGRERRGLDSPGAIYKVQSSLKLQKFSFGTGRRFNHSPLKQGAHSYLSNAPKVYGKRQQPGASFTSGHRELDLAELPNYNQKGYAGIAW